jgi:hypothetical protein
MWICSATAAAAVVVTVPQWREPWLSATMDERRDINSVGLSILARTVDNSAPLRHHSTVDRSRRSRFASSTPEVEAPTSDEQVTPDERTRRRLADVDAGSSFNAKSIDDFRRRRRQAEETYEVRPDADVSTGAIAAVEQESDDWRARWVLVEQDGSLVVRSLHLEPDERTTPPGGVTTNLLRELSPTAAIAAGAARLAGQLDRTKFADLLLIWRASDGREYAPQQTAARSGRPRLSDEHIAAVALTYLDELPNGPGVLRRLGERFNRGPETMRDQVRIARRRGFLTPAVKAGRKGAAPGPRLVEFMSEQREGESDE